MLDSQLTADGLSVLLSNSPFPKEEEVVAHNFGKTVDSIVSHDGNIYAFLKGSASDKVVMDLMVEMRNVIGLRLGRGSLVYIPATAVDCKVGQITKTEEVEQVLNDIGYIWRKAGNKYIVRVVAKAVDTLKSDLDTLRKELGSRGYVVETVEKRIPTIIFSYKIPDSARQKAFMNRDFLRLMRDEYGFSASEINAWRNLIIT